MSKSAKPSKITRPRKKENIRDFDLKDLLLDARAMADEKPRKTKELYGDSQAVFVLNYGKLSRNKKDFLYLLKYVDLDNHDNLIKVFAYLFDPQNDKLIRAGIKENIDDFAEILFTMKLACEQDFSDDYKKNLRDIKEGLKKLYQKNKPDEKDFLIQSLLSDGKSVEQTLDLVKKLPDSNLKDKLLFVAKDFVEQDLEEVANVQEEVEELSVNELNFMDFIAAKFFDDQVGIELEGEIKCSDEFGDFTIKKAIVFGDKESGLSIDFQVERDGSDFLFHYDFSEGLSVLEFDYNGELLPIGLNSQNLFAQYQSLNLFCSKIFELIEDKRLVSLDFEGFSNDAYLHQLSIFKQNESTPSSHLESIIEGRDFRQNGIYR